MKTLLLLASLVLVGAAGADEGCGGTTTAEGITAIEGAKRYRAQHECMMRLAERQNVTGSGTGQVTYPEEQTACEQKMQAAMRAMEERVTKNEESEWAIVGDGTATITWGGFSEDRMPLIGQESYKPDTRTAEERLEDEFKDLEKRKVELAEQRVREAKEQIEREERKAKKLKADQLWAEARQCWRKP